jgi:cytidylate kinase
LADKLGYTIVSIGDMKRKLAAEMGLNIYEFNKLGDAPEKAQEFDLKYEEYQKGFQLTDNSILDSRLGFYAQPEAFKILLDVDEAVASQRIFDARRETDKFSSISEALQEVKQRNLNDQQRYKKLYNVDVRDYKHYTLVIDTSKRTPAEILEIVLQEFAARKIKKGIAETPEEAKTLSKAKHKKSLLKNTLLLGALLVIAGFWIITTLLSR